MNMEAGNGGDDGLSYVQDYITSIRRMCLVGE